MLFLPAHQIGKAPSWRPQSSLKIDSPSHALCRRARKWSVQSLPKKPKPPLSRGSSPLKAMTGLCEYWSGSTCSGCFALSAVRPLTFRSAKRRCHRRSSAPAFLVSAFSACFAIVACTIGARGWGAGSGGAPTNCSFGVCGGSAASVVDGRTTRAGGSGFDGAWDR